MKKNSSLPSWETTLLSSTVAIRDAIKNLDESGLKLVLAIDEYGKLVGTVSDGDVRRGLLRGLNLDNPISEIMYKTPLVVPQNINVDIVTQLMSANRVHQIPIVDSNLMVIGLHLWDDVSNSKVRTNTIFIMAGGRGQRLMPLTAEVPKPMMHVAGKPMLQHLIERASSEGFRRFIISLHYLGHVIEQYFGDGKRFGVEIDYVREDAPLGTAGSIGLWKHKFEEPIIVTNGDVLSDIKYSDLLDFHIDQNADATMAVHQHIWKNPFGVVDVEGYKLVGFSEKPVVKNYVNAGIYVLSPKIIESIGNNQPVNMPDIFMQGKEAGLTSVVYPIHENWMDVGNPDDLLLANHLNS